MTDRLQREKDFHDKRFTEPSTRSQQVGRFYRLADSIQTDYRRLLAEQTAARILEYGCGTANYTFNLTQNGTQVVGIDISAVALQLARKANDIIGVSFSQMDAEGLAVANKSFDLVCGTGILHHLNLKTALPEIARVLQPNGRAIFIEPLGHNIFINLFRLLTPNIRSQDEHPLLVEDLAEFQKHFHKIETRYYYFTTLAIAPFVNSRLFMPLLRTAETIDQALFKLPFLQKQAWQILIQLSQPKL